MSQSIINDAKEFVFDLFKKELDPSFIYHNFKHTERVHKSACEIIEASDLTEDETLILELAAWLHDTGYINGCEKHEEESVTIASQFLKEKKVDNAIIDGVADCIMATRFSEEPQTQLHKIIRDADASHFGKTYFEEASEFLRKELELQGHSSYSPNEWREENINVLTTKHQFYTDYALKNWQSTKAKNLTKLMEKKKKRKKKLKKEEVKAKLKAKYKNESPERGIQTFYRVALRNHIKLSDIADTKANILLSVNAIIISLVLANLISKLDNNAYLIYPTAIFIFCCVVSMILSVIATRPNVTSGEFTKEDVKNKNVNLTFFGNFHKMKYEDYEWAINELIDDKQYIYDSLTKDLYYLGKVLERKYRILRITYTIFMAGIIISVLSFAIALKTHPGAEVEDILPEGVTTSYLLEDIQKDSKNHRSSYDLMVSIKSL